MYFKNQRSCSSLNAYRAFAENRKSKLPRRKENTKMRFLCVWPAFAPTYALTYAGDSVGPKLCENLNVLFTDHMLRAITGWWFPRFNPYIFWVLDFSHLISKTHIWFEHARVFRIITVKFTHNSSPSPVWCAVPACRFGTKYRSKHAWLAFRVLTLKCTNAGCSYCGLTTKCGCVFENFHL